MGTSIPVIIDTDIGTDVDDALAILIALASPELDVKGITTVYVDTLLRKAIAQKLLYFAGRPDIPVRAGETIPLRAAKGRKDGFWELHEGRGILYNSITKEEEEVRRGLRSKCREYVQLSPELRPSVEFLWDMAI